MRKGASLLDTLVGSAIFLVVALGFFGVLQLSIREASDSKARAGALMLANEWLEEARSVSYAQVGTTTGAVVGVFVTPDTVVINSISYTRRMVVEYVDDPKDGTGAGDASPNDYKKVKVAVSWQTRGVTREVSLVSNFVP